MHRFARELFVTATATAVMAAVVLIVGTVVAPSPTQPAERRIVYDRSCLDAPVTALSASDIQGQARLCVDGDAVRPSLWVRGLKVGQVYSAWLGYAERAPTGYDPTREIAELRGEDSAGMLRLMASGIVPRTGELELHGELRNLNSSSGGRVTLMLLSYAGRAGPHAQAVFVIP